MAFNLASFNQTAFNAGSEGAIWLEVLAEEKITPAVGTSLEAYITVIATESVRVDGVIGGNGVYITAEAIETVDAAELIGMSTVMIDGMSATETVTTEAAIRSESYLTVIAAETVTQQTSLGANIYVKGTGSELITAEAITDKETYIEVFAYELVSGSVASEDNEIHVCEINLTLQPGQRLVVDSGDYYVWLDNEIALDAQRGVWIDDLDRSTTSISVTAASGVSNLTASILYREQYL